MEKGEASRSFSALGGWKGLKYSVRDFDVVQECLELIMIFILISIYEIPEVKFVIPFLDRDTRRI